MENKKGVDKPGKLVLRGRPLCDMPKGKKYETVPAGEKKYGKRMVKLYDCYEHE